MKNYRCAKGGMRRRRGTRELDTHAIWYKEHRRVQRETVNEVDGQQGITAWTFPQQTTPFYGKESYSPPIILSSSSPTRSRLIFIRSAS